ncbi:MAG: hypothetical protein DLM68_09455 [Hyphomicrobiales bacterium]|nr:MAG: hypothetical protein DLM68_09455 [Hyphomicrobiales bacterium]
MEDTEVLDRHWRDEGLSHPLHRAMTFTQAGLALGRGTLLAAFPKDGGGKGRRGTSHLSLDGRDARVVSLLTAAYDKPVAEGVVEKIRRAAEFGARAKKRWRKFISPSSARRRSMKRTPTASSSPGRHSKKASTQVI